MASRLGQNDSQPGALLYLGDGHALQGDGELNGNALETSMSVDFTVDVIPDKRISGPRIETADAVISMGLMGSLDVRCSAWLLSTGFPK